jgi:hypothetical protein
VNGSDGTQEDDQVKPWSIDPRSLEALQQLGLASSSSLVTASGSTGQHKASDKSHGPSSHQYGAFGRINSSGPGDVSAALSKLSFAVDDLNKQLRTEITTHHADLLVQAGSVSTLEDNLRQIRGGLDEVESSVERLRRKIALPYDTLSASLSRLAKLQRASDLARRASRFVVLARRLDVQMAELNAANMRAAQVRSNGSASGTTTPNGIMSKDLIDRDGGERALSEAALTLAELGEDRQLSYTLHNLNRNRFLLPYRCIDGRLSGRRGRKDQASIYTLDTGHRTSFSSSRSEPGKSSGRDGDHGPARSSGTCRPFYSSSILHILQRLMPSLFLLRTRAC